MALLAGLYAVLVVGFILHPALIVPIGGYIALNLAYSFYLKHQPVLDIFSVAGGFVLRIYAGAEAIDVPLSSWMAVTTLCLALYLAAIKRRRGAGHRGFRGAPRTEGLFGQPSRPLRRDVGGRRAAGWGTRIRS